MDKIIKIAKMIRIEHSVFALPFALMSAFLAYKRPPSIAKILWILLAMVSARSAAMAFNRIADLDLDKKNPRTSNWTLPKQELSKTFVLLFIIATSILFIISAYMLNSLCFKLSPLALIIILTYSYTKRFTWLTHFFLGLSLSLAPMGAWIAIKENIGLIPLLLSLSVILWVAGFDIIYAIQDIDFDRKNHIHSIPARFGIKNALLISAGCHLFMILFLFYIYFAYDMGIFFLSGIFLSSFFLLWQHLIVKPNELSKINEAFFTANGLLSVFLFLLTVLDLLSFH